jgi:endonuclease/exonuclease/phosphatase family metal-dependent hydrolase
VTGGPASFPARLPMLSLDRILAWPKPLVSDVEVHDSPLARVASDHLPLTARLHLAAITGALAETRAAA